MPPYFCGFGKIGIGNLSDEGPSERVNLVQTYNRSIGGEEVGFNVDLSLNKVGSIVTVNESEIDQLHCECRSCSGI